MHRSSLIRSTAATLFSLSTQLIPANANAADIRVLCSNNMSRTLKAVVSDFEKTTGHRLVMEFTNAGSIRKRVLAGESADVVLVQRATVDTLLKKGKITSGSVKDMARSPMVVFVRAGAARPKIDTVEAFTTLLRAARSVSYPDPARGGLSGIFLAGLLERLAMAEVLKHKTILALNTATTVQNVAEGKAEFGMSQFSEIRTSGVDIVGRFPDELDGNIVLSAAVLTASRQPDAAMALVNFLSSPATSAAVKANRLDPIAH